jgi:DNA topoisomerase VI subunit A
LGLHIVSNLIHTPPSPLRLLKYGEIEKLVESTELKELDPWSLYIYAMKAPMTRDKYQTRLAKFLDFIGMLQGASATTLEGRARAFAKKGKEDNIWALNNVLRFVQFQKDRVDKKRDNLSHIEELCKKYQTVL